MKKIHYAWVACFSGVLIIVATMGLLITAFSVYQPYIIEVNGFTNTQASTLLTIRSLTSLPTLMFVDAFYRKLNLRWGMALTALLAAGCFFLYAVAKSFWAYCLLYGLAGVTYALGGMVPVSILINRWFRSRVALALGICSAGSGAAAMLAPPVVAAVIARTSLKTSFILEGSLVAVIALVIALIARNSPAEMGLSPLRSDKEEKRAAISPTQEKNIDRRGFVFMLLCIFLIGGGLSAAYGLYSVLYATEGFSSADVAMLIALAGATLMLGKCIYGLLTDTLGSRRSNLMLYICGILGTGLCCLAGTAGTGVGAAAMLLCGFGSALGTVGTSVFTREVSDGAHYSANLKWFQFAYLCGSMTFALVGGITADIFGSYVPIFMVFTVFDILSYVFLRLAYRRVGR